MRPRFVVGDAASGITLRRYVIDACTYVTGALISFMGNQEQDEAMIVIGEHLARGYELTTWLGLGRVRRLGLERVVP